MRNTMILFFTNVCNAKCSHCFISPLTSCGDVVMDYPVFAKALAFSEHIHIDRVKLSGGEPYIYWGKIREYLDKFSVKSSMRFSLCTNGFWACNSDERKHRLQELRSYNFDALEISTDSFHQEYIDFEQCIVPLLSEAISFGFRIDITVCYKNIMREATTINRIKQIITDKEHLHIRPISKFGRAKENMLSAQQIFTTEQKCGVAGEICVRYDGRSFICCGPPIVYDIPEFFIGDVLSDPFQTITERYNKKNKIIDVVSTGLYPNMLSECMYKDDDYSLCERCICYSVGNMVGGYDEKGGCV